MPSETQPSAESTVLDRVGQLLDYLDLQTVGGASVVRIAEVRRYLTEPTDRPPGGTGTHTLVVKGRRAGT